MTDRLTPKSHNTKNIESFHSWLKKSGYILTSMALFAGAVAVLVAQVLGNVVPQPASDAAINHGVAYEQFGLGTDGNVDDFVAREDQLGRTLRFATVNGSDSLDHCYLVYDPIGCSNNSLYWGAKDGHKLGLKTSVIYGFSMSAPGVADGYKASAVGGRDAYYNDLASALVSAGLQNAILRPSAGMNCSCSKSSTADAPSYIAAWKHMYQVFKTYNDRPSTDPLQAHFTFAWTPRLIPGTLDFTSAYEKFYPGKDYVDVVGLDMYDAIPGQEPKVEGVVTNTWADPQDVWDTYYSPSLSWLGNFAATNGHKVGTAAWALSGGGCGASTGCTGIFNLTNPSQSGQDNNMFVQLAYTWHNSLPSSGAGSLLFFNYDAANSDAYAPHDYQTTNNGAYIFPTSRARILKLFGGSGN